MDQLYEYATLISVLFLWSNPADWPPMEEPTWRATSLHDFWGKRWHQSIRRSLLVTGGYPFAFLFGPTGLALGTFFASGVLHHIDFYSSVDGVLPGWPVIAFFTAQAVGLALERMWKRRTGRRVGGWAGWLWVVLWIVVGGQDTGAYFLFSLV